MVSQKYIKGKNMLMSLQVKSEMLLSHRMQQELSAGMRRRAGEKGG